MNTRNTNLVMWAAIALILITGLIHLAGVSDSFEEAPYKGILFALNGIGAIIAAVGIFRGVRLWGWGLGLVIAAGAFAAYVASRTVGLPQLPAEPDAWLEPMGVASLVAEGLFTLLALWVIGRSPVSSPLQHGGETVSSR